MGTWVLINETWYYTTLGPAGAGVYRESPQRNNSATGNVVSHPRTIGTRKLRYE